MSTHIGYLTKHNVILCRICGDDGYKVEQKKGEFPNGYSRLFYDNVFPYKQTCHRCDSVIVSPQIGYWELFPKKVSQ